MSWKFLLTCFIFLVIGFTGLTLLDQGIVKINEKIETSEIQTYVQRFNNNINKTLNHIMVNFSFFKEVYKNETDLKYFKKTFTNFSSQFPSLKALYVKSNDKLKFAIYNNKQYNISKFTQKQDKSLRNYTHNAIDKNKIVITGPLNFFSNGNNYIIYVIPLMGKEERTTLYAIFNLSEIISNNITPIDLFKNIDINIKTLSNNLIYGKNLDDIPGDIIIKDFETPIGEWQFKILTKNDYKLNHFRQLVWILGFSLMAFLIFYMLIIEKKNQELVRNYNEIKQAEKLLLFQYEREQNLREIIQKIHTSDNIDNTLEFICHKLGTFLGTDSTSFISVSGTDVIIKVEYNTENYNYSLLGKKINPDSPLYERTITNKKPYICDNIEKDNSHLSVYIKKYLNNIKSVALFPIIFNDDVIGMIAFVYSTKTNKWTNDIIDYINSSTSQIALALHQNNLADKLDTSSKTIQETIRHELFLKNIAQIVRTSLDSQDIYQRVNEELGKFLNLDRVFVVEYNENLGTVVPVIEEFKSNDATSTYIGNEFFKELSPFINKMPDEYKKNQLIYDDSSTFFKEAFNSNKHQFMSPKFHLKSFVSTPITYQGKIFGTLMVTQIKYHRKWRVSEIELFNKVAEYLAVSIYQIKLYQELKVFTDKQIVMNKIFEVIRSSIDIDEIIWNSCNELGKFLQVDRCSILLHNESSDMSEPINHEYLSHPNIAENTGAIADINPDNSSVFNSIIYEMEPFKAEHIDPDSNIIKFHNRNNFLKEFNVNSLLVLPIIYADNVIASLLLTHETNHRRWSDSEIHFLKSIANQIAIGLYQAQLFKELNSANIKIMKAYKKEQTLRRILEVVRSSLDLQEIYTNITSEVGKSLELDRCYLLEFDEEKDKFFFPNIEYRSESSMKSIGNINFESDEMADITKSFKTIKAPLIFDNFDKDFIPPVIKEIVKEYNTKSQIIIPIVYQNKPLGLFFVTQTDYRRRWNVDEIEILKIVADQVAIAISQVKMYQIVQETSKLKSEFLASVSHELKTPLNSIIVLSELMQKENAVKSKKEEKELLNIIHTSGEELLKHINNILNMAKVEFTKKGANFETFNIRNLIDEINMFIKPLADENDLNLLINIKDNVQKEIYSDKELLKFIINNLMNNAIKFTPEGFIELSIDQVSNEFVKNLNLSYNDSKSDQYLMISVEDSGIGIDEEHHKSIFDEFRQVENTEVRKYGGTGLGLAICKKSVTILGGFIWFESQINKGSKFNAIIPLKH